jgi:hypothetical protein
MDRQQVVARRIRALIVFFIAALLASGLTAFPLEWELDVLGWLFGVPDGASPEMYTGLLRWITIVRNGLHDVYGRYPWLAYGTDWLAFAHIVLAILFIGPFRDPVRNLWIIDFGLIACILVIPLAMICGPIRGIPFYWRLIDCSFGVFGFVPLWIVRRYVLELQSMAARA